MSKSGIGQAEKEIRVLPGNFPCGARSLRLMSVLCLLLVAAACSPSSNGAAPSGQTAAAAQTGDAEDGRLVFSRICGTCHDATIGGPNKVGPNLFALIGRKSASLADYAYSDAMINANLTWDHETLSEFLSGPQKKVPGTKMSFVGLTNATDRADVLAYLQTLK